MNTTSANQAIRIDKELVSELKFPEESINLTTDERKHLDKMLEKCVVLGNGSKHKVKIFFEDNEGLKLVETTIWGVTEHNIILKQNRTIPTRRIRNVEIL